MNEPEPEPDPAREGIDWIRTKQGELRHPLEHRVHESAMEYWKLAEKLEGKKSVAVQDFVFEFQTTSVKLAGALTGVAKGHGFSDRAFTVACLKRALGHLHKAQAALEKVAKKKLLPDRTVAAAGKQLFDIREGVLKLMDEFRGR